MKKSKPIQVYQNDEQRIRILRIKEVFNEKTVSGTYKRLAVLFENINLTNQS